MTTYRKTSDEFSYTAASHRRVVEEYSDHESEDDPTPSYPALRVVTCTGESVSESTKPLVLAKCRQITSVRLPRKKAAR